MTVEAKTANELYESLSEQDKATIDALSKMLYALFISIRMSKT